MPERHANQSHQTSAQFYADNLKNLASEHKPPPVSFHEVLRSLVFVSVIVFVCKEGRNAESFPIS